MNDFNLEQYRTTWKNEANSQFQVLSHQDINSILKRESLDVSQKFRRGLTLDMAIKLCFLPALGTLLVLYRDGATIHWLNTFLLAFVAFMVFYQWKTLQSIPGPALFGRTLRAYLEEITSFYRKRYVRTVYVTGFTGPLVFYTGSLYYGFLKYGGVRPLDATDLVVFGIFLLLAFGISLAANLWQFRFHVTELETCLEELNADTYPKHMHRKRQFRRLVLLFLALAVVGAGLLLLIYALAF